MSFEIQILNFGFVSDFDIRICSKDRSYVDAKKDKVP